MQFLGVFNKFEQYILSMSLIHICDHESYLNQRIRQQYNSGEDSIQTFENNGVNQYIIYLPSPHQTYEDITLEQGLTEGYNIEFKPIQEQNAFTRQIPQGGHFVVVMKQSKVDGDFAIAAIGIFISPMAIFSLDVIIDPNEEEYQSLVIKHPIIRNYPSNWETILRLFLNGQMAIHELPQLVKYVDRNYNLDFRPPSWDEYYTSSKSFLLV